MLSPLFLANPFPRRPSLAYSILHFQFSLLLHTFVPITITNSMTIDNYYIADQFSLLAKLMDIHGENSFKAKSYSSAAFTIEKLPQPLADVPADKLFSIKGIGESTGKKIIEILQTGALKALSDIIEKTPPGILELLTIKGLGPKKIATIWKEMGIESIGELLYACNENRLMLYKGFGEKTQKNVQEAIEFYLRSQGSHLYAEIEEYTLAVDRKLAAHFPEKQFALTGEFRRQLEVIDLLAWVTTATADELQPFFEANNFATVESTENTLVVKGAENVPLKFYLAHPDSFYPTLFSTSCSEDFSQAWQTLPAATAAATYASEEAIFEAAAIPYLSPVLREKATALQRKSDAALIAPTDIKGIIHSHSNWSDGSHTIEEMAKACIVQGYEYLVISDHSKSAFYANGLSEERIREQHLYIDELNAKLAPFKIFKSIECDILNDGALDYSDGLLSTFDLVIASVHSNLKMTEEKAMMRLLNAISNPYTTILGHMTGRLLLSRPGYPVDHHKIIDACAEHRVTVELNAHPRRLDIDWRWIDYALEKGVLLSIDPDAHAIEGYADCRFGVLAAQKGGLTKERNLSSFSLAEFEGFLAERKQMKGI
ncbi:MAG: helix-hairpin-helix domain-containing protein [Candidatus Pseudobacter hemicellulosilyticus]|uniref:Helix-hairpin-helix domain-containing protein n=1 Tax=Candidatus Pseudobacter hemicellulosilyticus TaxID=3121375 RepID=A0AAJ5WNI8_9BACT|nr:MAG: helix-hairpin-helix domain-containing protein [Pseudobacter sp.]